MQTARHAAAKLLLALLILTAAMRGLAQEPQIPFEDWLATLIAEAREQGIREEIIEQALIAVTPIPQVINNDRSQAEFTETFEQYLEKRVTQWRIDTGRARLAEHHPVAAAHLDQHLRTGTYCCYSPDPIAPVEWQT